ncbi:YbiU family protein, partial [Pantoea sp.]|uniref:YbiU family protein n=1 Tax=Pantoea sp. TaxID=69393 RepID=UPI0028A9AF20
MNTSFTSVTLPDDHKAKIRLMKQQLRAQIGDVEGLFLQVKAKITQAIAEAKEDEAQRGTAWPVVNWRDIAEKNISQEQIDFIKRRGCVVVKQNFARDEALAWDKAMLEYLELNDFDNIYRGPGDTFFGSLEASRPEIYPIYWSKSQMEARQSEGISLTQSFLNRLWKFNSGGVTWFDPDVSIIYPDRIRRRLPGTTSKGLGAHTDSGALERWLLPAYQQVFRNIFNNQFADYDPWDAAHRTEVDEYDVANT